MSSTTNVRSRSSAASTTKEKDEDNTLGTANGTPKIPATSSSSSSRSRIGVLDVLRVVAGIVLLSSTLSYFVTGTVFWGPRPIWTRPSWLKTRLVSSDRVLQSTLLVHSLEKKSSLLNTHLSTCPSHSTPPKLSTFQTKTQTTSLTHSLPVRRTPP